MWDLHQCYGVCIPLWDSSLVGRLDHRFQLMREYCSSYGKFWVPDSDPSYAIIQYLIGSLFPQIVVSMPNMLMSRLHVSLYCSCGHPVTFLPILTTQIKYIWYIIKWVQEIFLLHFVPSFDLQQIHSMNIFIDLSEHSEQQPSV